MPSSPHRRRVELPAPLYETLAAQARHERRAVAAVVVDYILDGMSLREHYGQLGGEIADLRRAVRQLARPPPRPGSGLDSPDSTDSTDSMASPDSTRRPRLADAGRMDARSKDGWGGQFRWPNWTHHMAKPLVISRGH